ncbi:sensor histidine kinase [Shewanella litorisediminis]|uniref:histidine kinase n=1 Tax=Shewanella litorisediminis TaxID=1173586 RepID=A0ABX7G2L8_9GAMM|nr:HAMP domain-containing sensor histidine kinase [Shewanella litorisediminis]MCL2917022.1 HAMP domain-containing histidine kinase [Shewanella litorisediminis]QRH01503.1 HAMP domain-containing histidine kinase [Shewanella litorisediminis]
MKLATRAALLVGLCTFTLLGGYYLLAMFNASNAIVDFNQRSAVTLGHVLLDDDLVLGDVANWGQTGDMPLPPQQVVERLANRFDDHFFFLLESGVLRAHNLPSSVSLEALWPTSQGLSFRLRVGSLPSVAINFGRKPYEIPGMPPELGLIWVPKSLLALGDEQDALKRQLSNGFAMSFALLSLLAVVLAWVGAKLFLRPLKQLELGFSQLGSGDLGVRVKIAGRDEIAEIGNNFNKLAEALQRLQGQYKQLSSDMAHELRTPLNGVQSRLEAMQDGLLPRDDNQLLLVQADLGRITHLIDQLCLLSLTESGQLPMKLEPVTVDALLPSLKSSFMPQCLQAGMTLELEIATDARCVADTQRLTQILANLMTNAIKYAHAGGVLTLGCRLGDDRACIYVKDRGPGMSAGQQARAFDRFYRAAEHRSERHSLGLGLAISAELARLMSAELTLTTAPGEGCLFELWLVKAP